LRLKDKRDDIVHHFLGFILSLNIASIILLPEDGKAAVSEGLFSKEPSPYEETMSKIETLTKKDQRLFKQPIHPMEGLEYQYVGT
jgi:hypothetical protein